MKPILNFILVILFFGAALSLPFFLVKPGSGPDIDPYLTKFVLEWQADMDQAGIEWAAGFGRIDAIRFEAIQETHTGFYTTWNGTVTISHLQAEKGPMSVKGTLYHELGHAVFKLKHGDCALMARQSFSESELVRNWEQWKLEYLEACKKKEFEAKY